MVDLRQAAQDVLDAMGRYQHTYSLKHSPEVATLQAALITTPKDPVTARCTTFQLEEMIRCAATVKAQATGVLAAIRPDDLPSAIERTRDLIDMLAQLGAMIDSASVPTHQHRKGGLYVELGRGHLQCDVRPYDMAEIVCYRGEDGGLWFRSPHEFDDPDRFTRLGVKRG